MVTPPHAADPSAPAADPTPLGRWNALRDLLAAALMVAAALLPWNLYFGIGMSGSRREAFALLIGATVLSLGAVAATYTRHPRWRARLNAPYLLVVSAFLVFAVGQTVRYGGTAVAAPGVGPGAWMGLAGALLAAQPMLSPSASDNYSRFRTWLACARVIGIGSMALAALSVGFTLYWRTRQVIPGISGATFGTQSVAVIATAAVYGAAALTPVIIGSGWILQRSNGSRIALVGLGASTLAAGAVVWTSPIGREIDAFHGIAQSTSTAAVGFEAYLAWAAAAAIFGPLALHTLLTNRPAGATAWRVAVRKTLMLIAVWCSVSAAMRITDLLDAVSLHLAHSPAASAGLIAVDVLTAGLAWWLRTNLLKRPRSAGASSSLCAVLVVLAVSRVVAGVALAPRRDGPGAALASQNPVYGNTLAQQITSTFDVVVCGLALAVLAVALLAGRLGVFQPSPAGPVDRQADAAGPAVTPPIAADTSRAKVPDPSQSRPQPPRAPKLFREPADSVQHTVAVAPTDIPAPHPPDGTPAAHRTPVPADQPPQLPRAIQDPGGAADATRGTPAHAADTMQPVRGADSSIQQPLRDSTRRFAAGMTYTGRATHEPDHPPPTGDRSALTPPAQPAPQRLPDPQPAAARDPQPTSPNPRLVAPADKPDEAGDAAPHPPAADAAQHGGDTAPREGTDALRIQQALQASAQRFAAGTTYTGRGHPEQGHSAPT